MNADLALRFVVGIAGVGAALSAAQDLAGAAESSGTGLMSWTVTSAVPKRRISDVIGRRVMPWSRYRWVLLAKLAFGVLAPFAAAGPRLGCALVATILAASVMVTLLRSGYGLDGADQMSFIALASGAAGMILGPDTAAANVVLAFLAAQLALSYLVAGIAKLVSPEWRSGIGLQGVFSTASYREPSACGLRRFPSSLGSIGRTGDDRLRMPLRVRVLGAHAGRPLRRDRGIVLSRDDCGDDAAEHVLVRLRSRVPRAGLRHRRLVRTPQRGKPPGIGMMRELDRPTQWLSASCPLWTSPAPMIDRSSRRPGPPRPIWNALPSTGWS